jgi:hypothetical protein
MKFRSGMQFCSGRAAIRRVDFVVRSSIARLPRCRARSDGAVCTNRPLDVHLASRTGANLRPSAAYADHSPARTVGNRAEQ